MVHPSRILGRLLVLFAACCLVLPLPLAAGTGGGWRERAWPQHRERIEAALDLARAVDASDRTNPGEFAIARSLLARAGRPLPVGNIEEGAWQVRSIQVGELGSFAYPWFRARIVRTPAGLRFEKTTGSQRRSGLLLPHGDGRSLVFLGGATVNDEPQVGYSRVRAGGGPAPGDSAGRLYRIGARELLLVLDAADGRYELYHLKR